MKYGLPLVFLGTCAIGTLAGCNTDNLEPSNRPDVPPAHSEGSVIGDTLQAGADALIRTAAKNSNHGRSQTMQVKITASQDDTTRAIVRFDQEAIALAVGSGTLTAATLELPVQESGTAPAGNDIDLHRMLKGWTEAGVTWKCGEDLDLSNVQTNCPETGWKMSGANLNAFYATPTARAHLASGEAGVARFNVTGDVQAFLAGTSNHGWLVTAGNATSRAIFWSRETALKPSLILSMTETPVADRRLITVVGAGVTGSPATSDTWYPSGASVSYNFSVADGYHDLLVTLDGQIVPSGGSIVMDTVHFLRATALKNIDLPAGGEALLQSAQAILTASDPARAFQAHLNEVVDLYQSLDEAEATRRLQIIHFLAFHPIEDSAALRRVDDALSGRVFDVYPRPGEFSSIRMSALATDPREPTVYLYVNGIHTDEGGTLRSMGRLRRLMQSASLVHPGDSIKYFYNRTSTDQPSTEPPSARTARCASQLGDVAGWAGNEALFERLLEACMATPLPPEPDIMEAARQLIQVYSGSPKFEPDADSLSVKIQGWRNSGSHVIVVPHSEGNMMLQQAITKLRISGEFNVQRDSSCIGAMSLAAPTDQNWLLGTHYLKHVIVRGDLIPDLGGAFGFGPNEWERLDTPLSQEMDQALAQLPADMLETLVPRIVAKLYWGLRLHSVDESYLDQTAPRDSIAGGLATLYKECSIGSAREGFPGETVFPGHTRALGLYVVVNNQNGRPIYGRKFVWSTSDATIASITADGNLTTHSPGTAIITGKTGEHTATFTYTVQPVPDYGISGAWQGTWTRSDVFGPPEGGSLTLTLAQSGNTVSGTLTHTFRGTSYTQSIIDGTVEADFNGRAQVRFIVGSEEPGCCWWWQVSLGVDRNGRLTGSARGFRDGLSTGGFRTWNLARPSP